MKNIIYSLFLILLLLIQVESAMAEGFTANWVDIQRLHNGKYRVIIKYSNVQVAEYREVYVDFIKKKEAIDVFQKIAKGATFFWGDSSKIYFSKEKPRPY